MHRHHKAKLERECVHSLVSPQRLLWRASEIPRPTESVRSRSQVHRMRIHNEPRLCLRNLSQHESDGGRAEYLEQERRVIGSEPEMPTGDCAVVAVVHAVFRPPTGQSYREARNNLSMSIRPWMHKTRRMNEKWLDFWIRRLKQWVRPPKRNPIHGTPSHATGSWLALLGYELIYPNENNQWHCICDMACTYVLDLQTPVDHAMTVHQRIAYTTAPIDPDESDIGNVFRLSPEKTRQFKAWAQYERDEELWFRGRIAPDGMSLPDWEKRPRLEDYL